MLNSNGQSPQESKSENSSLQQEKSKKKRKRNNKNKNKSSSSNSTIQTEQTQPKVENLISKTFQEKVVTINAKQLFPTTFTITTKFVPCDNFTSKTETKNNLDKLKLTNKMVEEIIINPASVDAEKTREQIIAEREAKKLAKQQTKKKSKDKSVNVSESTTKELLDNTSATSNYEKYLIESVVNNNPCKEVVTNGEKTREQILAEREAKKLAKQQSKNKVTFNPPAEVSSPPVVSKLLNIAPVESQKSREVIIAEREAKKLAKQSAKKIMETNFQETYISHTTVKTSLETKQDTVENVNDSIAAGINASIDKSLQKKPTTKAERRAIQEAQRAAKVKIAQTSVAKVPTTVVKKDYPTAKNKTSEITPETQVIRSSPITKSHTCKVKLFNHLESTSTNTNVFVNDLYIHPIMVRLGEQYAKRTIVGSNARCISFLNALKTVIQDFQTPPKKEFSRSLETSIKCCVSHLNKCRPLAVSVSNAYKHIKHILTQLPTEKPESELKENLCHFIETYIENQIDKAAQAISIAVQEKICNGDVILTFGCSSLINYIFEEAHRRHVDFRVIVVDSRPFSEGQELLRRLTAKEIPCTYVLINAISFVMPEATKILLGAHALLSNGYVMARTGTAQVALVARSFNVPVLVCCETHKFSERFQTDAIVYNELGNPDDLIISEKCCLVNWQSKNKLCPLNLNYDITPPELVTAVVTDFSILPCTSVPVILRIKPTEIGYGH